MNSYDESTYGSQVVRATSGWPCSISTTVTGSNVLPSERRILAVTNGNVQGDGKTPNPIYFKKTFYSAGRGTVWREEIRNGTCFTPSTQARRQWIRYPQTDGLFESAGALTLENVFGAGTAKNQRCQYLLRRDQVRDRCLSKIYDKIRTGPNLIVDIAEGGATLRMLKSTLRFRRVLKEFFERLVIPKHLRSATAGQQRLDYMTSKWLEVRYGWTPLVNSIYDAFDQLNKHVFEQDYVFAERSGVSDYVVDVWRSEDVSSLIPSTPRTGFREGRTSVHAHWRCETQFIFRLPQEQHIYDWTSLDPASIAWELLPLSFVADWLITMGDYLELLENTRLYAKLFKGGYRTDTYKCVGASELEERARWTGVQTASTSLVSVHERIPRSPSRFEVKIKDRVKLDSLPGPSYPMIRVKIGAERQLDAASLVHQLVAKKFR